MGVRLGPVDAAPGPTPTIPRACYPRGFHAEHRPVAIVDLDFRFHDANDVFLGELAIGLDELRGLPVSDLWSFDPRDHPDELTERFRDLGVFQVDATASAGRPDAPTATLQLTPMTDAGGRRVGFTLVLVTERTRQAKRRISLDAEGFLLSFDQVSVGMVLTGLDGYAMRWNPAMERLLRRPFEEIAETEVLSMIHPDDRDKAIEHGLRLVTGDIDSYSQESRLLTGDGAHVWVHETASCVRDAEGNPLHFMSQFVDITDRKRAEEERNRAVEALRESEARNAFLLDGTPIPILEIDATLTIRSANAALAQLLGRDPIGVSVTEVMRADDLEELIEQGLRVEPDGDWITDVHVVRADGSERLVRSHGRLHHDRAGRFRSATASWHDITDAQQREDRLRTQAATDPLTGLPHRATFLAHLDEVLATATDAGVAVLFVDLDHFKPINDGYGHDAGDHLLCQVSRRLQSCVRATDMVARLGGDEFVVMIDLSQPEVDAEAIGRRIVERIAHPYATTYGTLTISASVGLAHSAPGLASRDLVHRADLAAYRAKADGRSRLALATDAP